MANDSRQTSNRSQNWGKAATPPGPGDPQDSGGASESLLERLGGYVPYWLTWRETMIGAGLGAAGVVVLVLLIAFTFTVFDSFSLSSTLDTVEAERISDTYSGWKGAYEVADETLANRSGTIRQFFHTLGVVVPVSSPSHLRGKLERRRAYTAAVLEYRYESPDRLRAEVLAWDAFDRDSKAPLAAAAQTYRLLANGETGRAVSVVEEARKQHPNHRLLHAAHLEAALAADAPSKIQEVSRSLAKARETPTTYEEFLLARAAVYDPEQNPSERLDSLLNRNSEHLWGKIEKIRGQLEAGAFAKARKGAEQLRADHQETASPFQLAHIHNLVGRGYAGTGDDDKARKSFQAAIDALPSRPSVYLGKIDALLQNGEFDAARKTIEDATSGGSSTPEIVERRAKVDYLEGRFDSAIDLLKEAGGKLEVAPILRGRILLEENKFDRAIEKLGSVEASHPEHSVARALELAARAAKSSDEAKSASSKVDKLVSDGASRPRILRAAARVYLQLGRSASGDKRDSHFERAQKLLGKAIEAQPERSINYYLSCKLHAEQGAFEKADEQCAKGRARNPEFLPGMLTVARLRLQQRRPRDAAMLMTRLETTFGDRWDVASLYVRTLLRSNDHARASEILDKWDGRSGIDKMEKKLLDGRMAYAHGDYAGALKPLEQARKSEEYGDEATFYLAHSLVRLGRLGKAEKPLDALTDVPKWKGAAWAVYAELRREEDEALEAIENSRIARRNLDMDSDPKWQISYAYVESAFAWQEHRSWRDTRVERFHKRGVGRGDPESPEMLYFRGLYYMYSQDRDASRAAQFLEKLVRLQPKRCSALSALEDAYRRTGNYGGIRRMNDQYEKHCE